MPGTTLHLSAWIGLLAAFTSPTHALGLAVHSGYEDQGLCASEKMLPGATYQVLTVDGTSLNL